MLNNSDNNNDNNDNPNNHDNNDNDKFGEQFLQEEIQLLRLTMRSEMTLLS